MRDVAEIAEDEYFKYLEKQKNDWKNNFIKTLLKTI